VNSEVIERLAAYAHYIWADWTRYMLVNNDAAHQERWRRQAYAGYKDLSENEKESDRHIARKWLDAVGQADLANKVHELQVLVEYKDVILAECKVQMEKLQARLAELEETNAKLLERLKEYQNSYHNATENLAERGKTILTYEKRVAELEADAKLGRMVREMHGGYKLICMADYKTPWLCLDIADDSSLYFTSEFYATPEAALEAA